MFEGSTYPENGKGMKLLPACPDSPQSSIRMGFLSFHLGVIVCLKNPVGIVDMPGSLNAVTTGEVGPSPALSLQVVQDRGGWVDAAEVL